MMSLHGCDGDDDLFGGNGEDKLFGENGNDFLSGENAKDELTGGPGADTFDCGNANDVTIHDFNPEEDFLVKKAQLGGGLTTIPAESTCEKAIINAPPTANSQSVSTTKNTAVNIILTGSDPDGSTLTFAIVNNPTHGTLSGFNPTTGAVTYTPTTGYSGPDSFTFKVNDGTVRQLSGYRINNSREPRSNG